MQILTESAVAYQFPTMPRSIRMQFPGAFYHVMAHGNRRETVLHDDDDRRFFLATLSGACAMIGWKVHAWVLMGNHPAFA